MSSEIETYLVYLLTNLVNGKVYVGKTYRSAEYRWKSHVSAAKNGSEYYIHKAIRKHGDWSFTVSVLFEGLTEEEAARIEIEQIAHFRSSESDFGYNLTLGGEGQRPNEETRKKLSACQSGPFNPMYGTHHTEESKENLSRKMKGRIFSEESIRKMSESRIGWVYPEETRNRQSEAAKRRWSDPEAREEVRRTQELLWDDPEFRAKKLANMGSGMTGRKHSVETKEKMKEAQRLAWARRKVQTDGSRPDNLCIHS